MPNGVHQHIITPYVQRILVRSGSAGFWPFKIMILGKGMFNYRGKKVYRIWITDIIF